MDKQVVIVVTAHRRRKKSMGDHHSVGVCRSTQRRLGVMGVSQVSYQLCVSEEDRFVDATAQHQEMFVKARELDGHDGSRVVVERLDEAIVVVNVEHVEQSIATGSRQQLNS